MDKETKEIVSIILLIFFPVIIFFASFLIGRYPISPIDVLNTLLSPIFPQLEVSPTITTIVFEIRLPRIIGALVVGACLAISGAAFQSIFKNPLVSSDLLGVSNGAGFGAALGILLSGANIITQIFAFIFGLISVSATYLISKSYKAGGILVLVLSGVAISAFFNALISAIKFIADPDDKLPEIVYWLMGSLASVGWESFFAVIPIAAGCVLLMLMAWRINVLSMGDKEARTLGVNVGRDKLLIICGASLATAGAVCMSGMIGWVGLVIPHIGRMITGNDNRRLMPVAIATGASFMILIDLISRTITAQEIPLGILTSLIGAPFFVYLLKKTKGGGW